MLDFPIENGKHWLVKTNFVSKMIMFSKTSKCQDVINLCYGKQEIQELQGCVLNAHRWAIYKMVVKIMFTIVK